MRELFEAIPDVDAFLAFTAEELGAKLLFALRRSPDPRWSRDGAVAPLIGNLGDSLYPAERHVQVEQAFAEAWAWLEAQGLLIPSQGINGNNGFRRLSRRALSFADEREFVGFAAARLLPKDLLHEDIPGQVWLSFLRGEWDLATFQAMRAVEIKLRNTSGIGQAPPAIQVARQAFHPETGVLTDAQAEGGEREAMSSLFAGALGVFKNPYSHREVPLDDAAEAASVIMFASHLLRIIDTRAFQNADAVEAAQEVARQRRRR